jgi:hypothetical protein
MNHIMAFSAKDNSGLSSEDELEIVQSDKSVLKTQILIVLIVVPTSGPLQAHQCLIYACNDYNLQPLSSLTP